VANTGTRTDPLLAFRFEVRIGGLAVGGFSECSGLQLETDVQDYPEGGVNGYVRKLPTRTRQANLRLRRGIVDRTLWDWYYELTQGVVRRRSGSVVVHDPSGADAVAVWRFDNAFPAKWLGPELNATQNQVAVETVELCHEGLVRER
jgi:phage tail-like protein